MIGIIVEGKSDREAIREICKKLGVDPKIRQMKGNNFQKAKSFALLLRKEGCRKVILLKDCHHFHPSEIEERFRNSDLKREVELCIVKNAIEAWFLADSSAISDYLHIKVDEIAEPEKIQDPAEYLEKIFKKAGKHYFKGGKDPEELAKKLDFEKLRKKCCSFRRFENLVLK